MISYHYNCTIFDDRGVKMVHLGVYCNVDIVDMGDDMGRVVCR